MSATDHERHVFRMEALYQGRCGICNATGAWHPHHVVHEQHLRNLGCPTHDRRNALRVCLACHASHHLKSPAIAVGKLPDIALEHGFEMLGPAAVDYFRRYYDDSATDERLDELLAQAEMQRA